MLRLATRTTRALGAIACVAGVGVVLTAANTVPPTQVGTSVHAVSVDSLKPAACAGISVSTRIAGSGTFSGTGGSDLLLGSGGGDTITALGGDDCVVGSGGDDTIDGGGGSDVCIGGPGADTFIDCETEIQ
jgi:hypothetical protein